MDFWGAGAETSHKISVVKWCQKEHNEDTEIVYPERKRI